MIERTQSKSLPALLLLLIISSMSQATVAATYTYTGVPYIEISNFTPPCSVGPCAAYPPGSKVTGLFTTAAPLPPNSGFSDPIAGFSATVTDFLFTDGINTYSSADPDTRALYFQIATDANGSITDHLIQITRWQSGTRPHVVDPQPPFARSDRVSGLFISRNPVGGAGWSSNNYGCSGLAPSPPYPTDTCGGGSGVPSATSGAASVPPGQPGLPGTWGQTTVVDVVEYYNASLDHYFITADANEMANLDGGALGGAWKRTGESFPAWEIAGSPQTFGVCRFAGTDRYRSDGTRIGPNSHFYTVSREECDYVMQAWQSVASDGLSYPAWTFEGLAFAVGPAHDFCEHVLHRAYNDAAGGEPNHRYSRRPDLLRSMAGWSYEGPVMCLPLIGPPAPVVSVSVTPSALALLVAESQQLTATARDEVGNRLSRSVTWTTTDPTVATVSATGRVTGVGPGSAVITATSEGKSASATVSVACPSVTSVRVSPSELTLLAGASQQFTAMPQEGGGNPLVGPCVAWASSAPTVATVSESGLVSGVGLGSATITATSEGKTGNAVVTVVASVTFASVAAGGVHTCALTTSGAAFCWGRGERGQLGKIPTTTCRTSESEFFPCSLVPVAVGGGLAFEQLAGGGSHTCGLTSDGSAYCWGNNVNGQLGDNSTTDRESPVPVATALRFASIDAGARHTCGLTSEGTAHCWGNNNLGQLGDGTTTNSSVPVAVTGGHTFQLIVAGGFEFLGGFANGYTCGLTRSGDAYCWGENIGGQLGIGAQDFAAHPTPLPVSGELKLAALTAGLGRHTCGLTGTGAAHCWGNNEWGALGDGSNRSSLVPVPVSGGLAFVELIAGGFVGHTCGRTASGTAYCWGDNEVGQLGDGSTVDRLEPSAVADGVLFTSLDAGFRHTCGRATTGALYCWGGNLGQLGDGTTTSRSVPTKVFGQP